LLRSIRILGEGSARSVDAVLSFGEILSSRILCSVMESRDLDACWIDPRSLLATDGTFGAAVPDLERTSVACRERIVPHLDGGGIPVTGGFVGSSADGAVTTLGRGGSDTSAAVLGAVLAAEEIQIWTDVDGLMTADPAIVPTARTLESVSFAEAAELAFHGARVLHPSAIAPAVRRRIPVRILNSLNPASPGTLILEESDPGAGPIASVSSRTGIGVLRMTAGDMSPAWRILEPALRSLARVGYAPELLATSEVTVSAVMPGDVDLEKARRALSREPDIVVEAMDGMAVLCVVGSGIAAGKRMRGEVLAALAGIDPEIAVAGGSSTCIAAVIRAVELERATGALHHRFFDSGESG
jgi:aspartate kinase